MDLIQDEVLEQSKPTGQRWIRQSKPIGQRYLGHFKGKDGMYIVIRVHEFMAT